MEKNRHYFYALKLPNQVKGQLQDICTDVKMDLPFKSWVHHEDYHITLAFLGQASEEQLETSLLLVRESVTGFPSFPLSIAHLGVFGKKDSPRIFWAGLEEEAELFKLRELVFRACQKAGFKLETRPFHPHITLARKWKGDYLFQEESIKQSFSLQFDATEVVLYETQLEKIPKYEGKETFPLRKSIS